VPGSERGLVAVELFVGDFVDAGLEFDGVVASEREGGGARVFEFEMEVGVGERGRSRTLDEHRHRVAGQVGSGLRKRRKVEECEAGEEGREESSHHGCSLP